LAPEEAEDLLEELVVDAGGLTADAAVTGGLTVEPEVTGGLTVDVTGGLTGVVLAGITAVVGFTVVVGMGPVCAENTPPVDFPWLCADGLADPTVAPKEPLDEVVVVVVVVVGPPLPTEAPKLPVRPVVGVTEVALTAPKLPGILRPVVGDELPAVVETLEIVEAGEAVVGVVVVVVELVSGGLEAPAEEAPPVVPSVDGVVVVAVGPVAGCGGFNEPD